MAVTFAQPSESLAPNAEICNEKRDIPISKRATECDEATEPDDRSNVHVSRLYQFFAAIRSITIGKSGCDISVVEARDPSRRLVLMNIDAATIV